MTAPTTDDDMNIERVRLSDVQQKLRDEMMLLPRTPELMIYYEKKYIQAVNNCKVHDYNFLIAVVVEKCEKFRLLNSNNEIVEMVERGYDEKIADLQKRQREDSAPIDWDKYFLNLPLKYYVVDHYFGG